MKAQSEAFCIIKYIFLRGGLYKLIIFNLRKIINKVFFVSRIKNYPCDIKYNVNRIFKKMIYETIAIEEIKDKNCVRRVKLASKYIELSPSVNWSEKFDDYEDYEALHRFRWIRDIFSKEDEITRDDIHFINMMIKSWCVHNNTKMDTSDLSWCSHTVSERICNIIVFKVHISNMNMSSDLVDKLLNNSVKNLLTKLEYYPYGFGNHLINNLRATLLYSLVFNDEDLENTSFNILSKSLNIFIFNTYTLDQSSHYQMLLYYWLYDISHFSKKYSKGYIVDTIDQYLNLLEKSSMKFINKNNHIVHFGDISPDCSPKYLSKLVVKDITGEYNPYQLYNKI